MQKIKSKLFILLVSSILILSMTIGEATIAAGAVYITSNFNTPILNWNQVSYSCPWVGNLEFLYSYSSHSSEYSALLQGKVDMIQMDHASEIEQAITKYNKTIYVAISPQESFGQLVFAFGNNLTANVYFRYAISNLINLTYVTDYINDNGILGKDIPYYVDPQIAVYKAWFNPAVVTYYQKYESYNLTMAVQHLMMVPGVTHTSSGQWLYKGSPLKITFLYPTDDLPGQKFAEYLSSQAAAINLTIAPEAVSFGTLITDATTPPFNDFNMTTFGWINLGPWVNSWMTIYTDPADVAGFSNSTIDTLINNALNAASVTSAENYIKQAEYDLQVEEPYVINVWSNGIQGLYLPGWANYVYLNSTSEYPIVYEDVHPTGTALQGTFIWSFVSGDMMRHLNPYASTSVYAFNELDELYPSLAITNDSNQYQLLPWLAESWKTISLPNTTLPNGDHIINGTELVVNLVHNATWIDGVPVTAYDVNFTIWWYDLNGMMGTNSFDGLTVNYTYLIDNGYYNSDLLDTIPGIVWTNVTNPYQIEIFLNTSSITQIDQALDEYPVVPAHVFAKYNPATVYAMKVAPLISSAGYIFSYWSTTKEVALLTANLHSFRIDPLLIYQGNFTAGTPVTYVANFTSYTWDNSTVSLVPHQISNATVYVYLKYLNVPGEKYTNVTVNGKPLVLTAKNIGNGLYNVTIPTKDLAGGLYEIVAKAVWTVNGQSREEFDYASFAVKPVVVTTVPPVTHPPTTTVPVTTTPPINVGLIAGIVIVVIVIVAVAVVLLRRR
ncbi:peptide ABC transporter substrate-binding protein [Candidatus Acidianus copahuensis]|uniref:Peptide ABC transporter substrate-binding protein n=1 Tax=Candidatus Acidianus copahuensis TaxID=1160895 RepID=A0A031LNZ6_9CREN|nr:ABC transporter substrate-binding protein [Candidatus Acidianus copahuensis]EZQ04884.1 peptide ABC transporter substrate-binding protein [Candidatus Acidianus copahuensis]